LSRPNSKKHSGNKIEIKIELTYAFSNRIPVWESGRSAKNKEKGESVMGKKCPVALGEQDKHLFYNLCMGCFSF